MQFKSFMEALKGKQHKIDKNKNGQIDAHDFKLLRKEESEETIEESEERMARADYKVGASGRKSHKEIVFTDAESKDDEEDKKDMKEAKMSDADMAERERIVKGMKKNLAGFKARYGDRAKEVMYATATKQAMKEETVEEAVQKADIPAYLRKQQGQTPLKLSDLKRKDTISDKENLAKLRNEEAEELEESSYNNPHKFAAAEIKAGTFKSYSPDQLRIKKEIAADRLEQKMKKLDQQKMKKEEAEELDEKSDQAKQNKTMKNMMSASKGARINLGLKLDPTEYGYKRAQHLNVAIGRAAMKAEATVPFDGPYTKIKPVKNSDGTTQQPMSRARELAKQAMKQKMKEEFDIEMSDDQADSILDYIDEQAPVAPVPDKKYIKGTPEYKAYMATKKSRVGHPTNVKEEFELDEVEHKTLSYTDFVATLLEYETKGGRYVHKGTYGGSYSDPEGADDADDKKPKQQSAEKRGRGRPAGAKSGARKITGTSKLFK